MRNVNKDDIFRPSVWSAFAFTVKERILEHIKITERCNK